MSRGHDTVAYSTTDAFERFLDSTDEKQVLGHTIRSRLGSARGRLLDVGAGNGDLTAHYIEEFQQATLVDVVPQQAAALRSRFPSARVIQGGLDAVPTEVFDAIVASHVFVYFEQPKAALLRLATALARSGRLIVVMLDQTSDYVRFVRIFSPRVRATTPASVQSAELETCARSAGMSCEVSLETTVIETTNVDDFLAMNPFHFNVHPSAISGEVFDAMRSYLGRFVRGTGFKMSLRHRVLTIEPS